MSGSRLSQSDRIAPSDLDAVRGRASAEAVARLHGLELKPEGALLRALCPLHPEKSPSFTVYAEGHAHCFGCGWHGDGIALYQALANVGFRTAVRELAERFGIALGSAEGRTNTVAPCAAFPISDLAGAPLPFDQAWPIAQAEELYRYTDADDNLVCYEARVLMGQGRKQRKISVPCRPSPYGLIRGVRPGLYQRDPKSDPVQPAWRPWRKDGSVGERRRFPGVDVPLFNLPALLADRKDVIFLAEGPKDATTVKRLGLLGTSLMFGAGAGGTASPQTLAPLAGRRVAVLQDGDEAGAKGAATSAAALHAIGAAVRVLPPFARPDGGAGKCDVSDWAEAERRRGESADGLARALRGRYEAATPYVPGIADGPNDGADDRPAVLLSTDERRVNDAVLAALAAREKNVFQRSGLLVEVLPGDEESPPRAAVIEPPRLREITTSHVRFQRPGADGPKPAHPPEWCVRALAARSAWRDVRPLRGLAEGPLIRADASILDQPGYDDATGLLYRPRPGLRFAAVPDEPSKEDIDSALALLMDVVADFPFEEEIHRAAWLTALLTVVARPVIRGTVPLFLADASTPGAGKGKVLHTVALIATGRPASFTEWPADPSEQRKVVATLLLEGARMVVFDNVTRTLGGATLDMLLTSSQVRGRVLGQSKSFDMPNTATWMATANNCDLGGDTARRTLQVRLRPDVERPELRADFAHRDLEGWVHRQRGHLLPAALTLLRAYWLELRPHEKTLDDLLAAEAEAGIQAFGMAEAWSVLIRGCAIWLGLPDPALTREALRTQSSLELTEQREIVRGFADYLNTTGESATTTKNLCVTLQEPERSDDFQALKSALNDACRLRKGDLPTPRRVGKLFSRYKGRIIDGRAIKQVGETKGAILWGIETLER